MFKIYYFNKKYMKAIFKKPSILNVTTLEEEIYLIQESERIWWEMDAKEAYFKGLEFINNLK